MNTHGKIELPPLPPADRYFEFDSHRMKASIDIPYWGEKSLEAYALAAVEADRKNTAELLKNPVHVHTNMCRGIIAPITFDQLAHVLGDEATEAWLADRRHSGEPVAWVTADTVNGQTVDGKPRRIWLENNDGVGMPIYTSPQPAEPSRGEPVALKEIQRQMLFNVAHEQKQRSRAPGDYHYQVGSLLAMIAEDSQPAEPVRKTDWNNELASWSDEDFIRIFHEHPDLANRLRKMLVEPIGEVLGETCIDGGKCHHGCKERCFRRQCCEPFSDYSGPWEYAAETIYPQPTDSVNHSIQDCPEDDKWNCKYCKRVNSCPVQGYRYAQPVESMKTLIDNQEPLGEEFQRVLDEHSWDLYVKAAEPHQPLSKSVAKRLAIQLEGRDEPAKSHLKVSYDAHGDCLYVVCDSNEPADAVEDDKGIIYRRATSDGRLVGITVPNFMGRHAELSDDAPQPTEPVKVPSDGERAAQGLPPYNPRKPTEEEWNRLTENGRKAWGKNETEPVNVPLDQAGAVGHAFSLVRRLKNDEPVEDELRQVIRQIAAEAVNAPHATVYCQHPHCQTTGGCQGPCSKKQAEPVKVPSDESIHMWKKIEEYSREMYGKKIDIYLGNFLLYCPELEDEENNGVVIGHYSEPYKGWYASETLDEVFPTHFMPLPEKP